MFDLATRLPATLCAGAACEDAGNLRLAEFPADDSAITDAVCDLRQCCVHDTAHLPTLPAGAVAQLSAVRHHEVEQDDVPDPVSYTHLTLPTILRV